MPCRATIASPAPELAAYAAPCARPSSLKIELGPHSSRSFTPPAGAGRPQPRLGGAVVAGDVHARPPSASHGGVRPECRGFSAVWVISCTSVDSRSSAGSALQRESITIIRCASTRSTASAGGGPYCTETFASATTPRAILPASRSAWVASRAPITSTPRGQLAVGESAADLPVGVAEPDRSATGSTPGGVSSTTWGAA